jgi:hypothetical protein
MRPDFLYIGPDKSGSTWLYEVLRRHPEVFVPSVKDLYFFDRNYDRGVTWYEKFFAAAPVTARAVGELSHDYLFSPEAARRIRSDLPGVRLITSLRDPADRTFSHYLYLRRSGITRAPFSDALANHPELIDNSRYSDHLAVYYDSFPHDRIRVLFFEDLVADATAFAEKVFEFLGVSSAVDTVVEHPVLAASRPRSFLLAHLAKRGANVARTLGLPGLVGAVKGGVARRLLYVQYRPEDRPRLDPADRARLIEGYREGVERLARLTGRDLEAWLQVERPATPGAREADYVDTRAGGP